jgi:hypothetical protein
MEVGGDITGSGVLAKVIKDWREYWYCTYRIRKKKILRGFEDLGEASIGFFLP